MTGHPRTKNDVYAAFVERGIELVHPTGYLGAITSRAGFFLDGAMVEVAARAAVLTTATGAHRRGAEQCRESLEKLLFDGVSS